MKRKDKKKYFFFLTLVFVIIVYYNKMHYDFYNIINSTYQSRVNESYGYCDRYGYVFIKKSLKDIKKHNKIAIHNTNDLAGIRWKFSEYKNLKYLNNLNTYLDIYDYLFLISNSDNERIKIFEDKIKINGTIFLIKNKFNNCYFLKKL
jgi:hypothetical protein